MPIIINKKQRRICHLRAVPLGHAICICFTLGSVINEKDCLSVTQTRLAIHKPGAKRETRSRYIRMCVGLFFTFIFSMNYTIVRQKLSTYHQHFQPL